MSTQQSREEQITGHGNLNGTLYPSLTKTPGWKLRKLVPQILKEGEDALIAVDISARTSLDDLLCFQPCVAVFTRRLPVLGVIKASVVEDLGLTPLEFKSHLPVVETIWGELTATHYVEVVLKQELYGFKGTSWENLLVVADDLPRLPGDVFLGQPFLRKHCCNALPAKVPRHAGPQASSRHVTQDNSGDSGRKGTAKKPRQPKKRERSPQQAIPGGQQHVEDGQSSKKRSRTPNAAAFQQPAQMPNTDWVNQNQCIIGLPPQSPYGNRTRMPAAPTGPAVPWRNESMYPVLHLTLAYHRGEKLWLRQLYSWVVEMSSKAELHVPLCGSGRLSIDGKARPAVLDQTPLLTSLSVLQISIPWWQHSMHGIRPSPLFTATACSPSPRQLLQCHLQLRIIIPHNKPRGVQNPPTHRLSPSQPIGERTFPTLATTATFRPTT